MIPTMFSTRVDPRSGRWAWTPSWCSKTSSSSTRPPIPTSARSNPTSRRLRSTSASRFSFPRRGPFSRRTRIISRRRSISSLRAPFRVGNAAREDEIDRRLEIIRVLLEKGPRLGKENLEALVDRNLRLVGFDLAEVGIGGRVDDELIFEHHLGVQAHLPEGGSARVEDVARIV